MKFAIIGYGKMGKMIETMLLEKGHEVAAIIDPSKGNAITDLETVQADICFEFTHPDSVLDNLQYLITNGKDVVVGTTGLDNNLEEIKTLVEKHNTGFFHASNFSIGMNLFLKITKEAAKMILPTNLYDPAGIEAHHNQKFDSPSGTAITIANAIKDVSGGVAEIPFTSVRCGSIPGTHTVLFDSPVDTITLTHTARSRAGFASGAIAAAEWLHRKKGFFTMDDMLFPGGKLCKV